MTPGTRSLGRRLYSSFSHFSRRFRGYSTLFGILGTIFRPRDRRYTVSGVTFLLVVLAFSGRFRVLRTLFWVSGTIFGDRDPPVHGLWGDVEYRRFHVLWLFSWAIAHRFVFRGRFSDPVTPGTRSVGRRRKSLFSCFVAVFVGYGTPFCVPGTIFGARDPWYTVSGATSIVVVFAFCCRFRVLKHTILGFGDDFRIP